jgi:hypothetical protein
MNLKIFKYNKWHRNYLIRRYFYGPILSITSYILYLVRFIIPKRLYGLSNPIFVVGCSRSGTTMFIECFHQHPDLCDWSEAAQIMELNFYSKNIDHFKEGGSLSGFDAFRIRFMFGFKRKLMRRKYFVNKHPENSLRIKWIKLIFPGAKFIHMYRDGRAVIASNFVRTKKDSFRKDWPFGQFPKPIKWRNYLSLPLYKQFSYQWLDITQYIQKVLRKDVSVNEYVEISYEDFCREPLRILRKLDLFCGLNPDRRLADPKLNTLVSRNNKWKELFSEDEILEIESIIGGLNDELGYSRQYKD